MPPTRFIGVDFGAKLAGTTAVCFEKNSQLHLLQSTKKQDADAWLHQIILEQNPSAVYMDAPLSLPGVYHGKGEDFHYRACDRAVGAMSPMFLGGLTARAMKLCAAFSDIPFFEIYPAQQIRLHYPTDIHYKKNLAEFLNMLSRDLPKPFGKQPENWHQLDAALAWISGWRHQRGEALKFGEENEGLIWV
jgi:uncharacterized protein